jgi:hypothetical protein
MSSLESENRAAKHFHDTWGQLLSKGETQPPAMSAQI